MLGGNNGNPVHPAFLDETQLRYQTNAANQLQLFGNLQAGHNVDPVNYFGKEHISPMIHPNKRSREVEDISKQQRLQISLNNNIIQDDVDRSASIPKPNPVSTGLRLSYDDDEHNSSVTSASGNMTASPSVILSLGDYVRTESDRQQQEMDEYIKLQKEQLSKAVRDIRQKHVASLLTSIENGVGNQLREKDMQIENMNCKNRELEERVKQVANDVQTWQYRARYNESVVNVLRNNLQQAISQGVEQGKEGFGDNELDDTASYIDPNNFLSVQGAPPMTSTGKGIENLTCKACKAKEVSRLLMPCRHLCLCKDCDGSINVCPVCQMVKTASVEVYLS